MTSEQLDEIEKLAEAATPGRWSPAVWQGNDDTGGWAAVGPHQESTDCICEGEEERTACAGEFCADDRSQNDEEQAWEDAKAIAALHNAFPAMAKALREARAERDALKGRDERWVKIAEQYERELDEYRRRIGTLLDQLAKEEADAHQFQKERDVARARLSNLLARIHRDGGHYEAKNGTTKAVVDADVAVAQAFAERDEARAEVERLREIVKTAGDRLKACAYELTEFSYQEMASALFDLPTPFDCPVHGEEAK